MITRYKDATQNYLAIGGKHFSVTFELTHDGDRRKGLYIVVRHPRIMDKKHVKRYYAWLSFSF